MFLNGAYLMDSLSNISTKVSMVYCCSWFAGCFGVNGEVVLLAGLAKGEAGLLAGQAIGEAGFLAGPARGESGLLAG